MISSANAMSYPTALEKGVVLTPSPRPSLPATPYPQAYPALAKHTVTSPKKDWAVLGQTQDSGGKQTGPKQLLKEVAMPL